MEAAFSLKEFNQIRDFVYELTRINLSESKQSMLISRLNRRLRATNCATFGAYYELIRSLPRDSEEITEFINAVTTNTTHFFREPHHFEHCVSSVLPLRRSQAGDRPPSLRVWHAGCSTGEEPYTLAISLQEAIPNHQHWDIKQLATDIDTRALEVAIAGVYDQERLNSVAPELHARYFLRSRDKEHPKYKVKPSISQWLTFRQLNLLAEQWPLRAETQFDVIFCRNVMIYFDKQTQKTLVDRFAKHLKPGGTLYIGHSESLHGMGSGLRLIGHTTYQKDAISFERAA